MSRAGRSNSGRLEPVWQQQVVMMEAVGDVSWSRARGVRKGGSRTGGGGVVKQRDDGWDGGARRELWETDGTAWYGVLEPGCSDKVGSWDPGQLVHAGCALQGCLSYALPGQVPRRDKVRLALTWAARKGKPGLP